MANSSSTPTSGPTDQGGSTLTGVEYVDGLATKLGAWNAMVRRARLTDEQKLMCLLVSSYANNDGRSIYCGIATLAVDSGKAYSTARRYMAWMRRVGLIELVRAGNRRAGYADEYRLIIGPKLGDLVHIMDPDEYEEAKETVKEENRRTTAIRQKRGRHAADDLYPQLPVDNPVLRSPGASVEKLSTGQDLRSPGASVDESYLRSPGTPFTLTLGERPPPLYTSPLTATSPKPPVEDVRTDLTVERAKQDPISFGPFTLTPGT